MLRNRLQSLTESHSAVLASSEQLASTHRKAETQVAEQLQMRQQELSRTRAQVSARDMISVSLISPPLPQVSSLSTELAGEKKMAEELRSQLTLARAEAARHQAQVRLPLPTSLVGLNVLLTPQVSSRQRSSVLGNMAALGLVTGHHTYPSPSSATHTSTDVSVVKPVTIHSRTTPSASQPPSKPDPPAASSTAAQRKGQVIDL